MYVDGFSKLEHRVQDCLAQNWTLKIWYIHKSITYFPNSLKEAEENAKQGNETRIRRSAEKVNFSQHNLVPVT